MNYLGIDYGEKRVGLSFADDVGVAVPLPAAVEKSQKERLEHISEIISSRKIEAIVIGYPYNMDDTVGFKAKEVDAFIEKLEKMFGLTIYRQDERLSSHQAQVDLKLMGMVARKKSVKSRQNARRSGDLDSRAATLILQDYLDANIT